METIQTAAADSLGTIGTALTGSEFGPALLRAAGGLAVVLLLLGALSLFARRWLSRGGVRASGSLVRVLNRVPIGRRAALLLVEIDGRRILIGVTPTQLSALTEWDETPEPDVAVDEARMPQPAGFDAALGRVLARLRSLEGSSA
jgi:flagellar protein FliO/FliZ